MKKIHVNMDMVMEANLNFIMKENRITTKTQAVRFLIRFYKMYYKDIPQFKNKVHEILKIKTA